MQIPPRRGSQSRAPGIRKYYSFPSDKCPERKWLKALPYSHGPWRLAHIGSLCYSLPSLRTWVNSHRHKMWRAGRINQLSEHRPGRHCTRSAVVYSVPPPTPCYGFVYTATGTYSLCRAISYPIFKEAVALSQPQRRPFAAHYKRHSSARGRKAKSLGTLCPSVTVDGDSKVCREAAPGLGRWRVRAEGEASFIDPD